METIALHHFRDHLQEYLDRARKGEHIVITEEGEEVAQLGPVSHAEERVQELVEEGQVAWSGGKPSGLRGVGIRGEPVSDTVIRERR